MLDQTNAYKILKSEQQKILDFSKLVCYPVPNLKKSIKGFKEKVPNYETFVKPDYFIEPLIVDRITGLAKHYKDNLSKYILISSFSFFEAYFRDVVAELIEFHGGLENLIKHVQGRQETLLNSYSKDMLKKKSKLQTNFQKVKWQKYKRIIKDLEKDKDYRHPSELFSAFGVKSFFETVSSNSFKSIMIPDFIEIGFGLDLSEKVNKHTDLIDKTLRETFDIMRDTRNGIGHGKANTLTFEKVMEFIRFIRYLSVKLDNHLMKYHFVIQRYN